MIRRFSARFAYPVSCSSDLLKPISNPPPGTVSQNLVYNNYFCKSFQFLCALSDNWFNCLAAIAN